jgi:hypothetical protein
MLPLARQAVFGYDLARRVGDLSDAEYVEHLFLYKSNFALYESHREELSAERALLAADRDYLAAILADPREKSALLESAARSYERARVRYVALILRYYIPGEIADIAFPQGVTRANFAATISAKLDEIPADQLVPILARCLQLMEQRQMQRTEEIDEYIHYLRRCDARLE